MEPHVTETMTMATDYILTVQSSVYAWLLSRRFRPDPTKTVRLWIGGLVLAAVGALAGGTAHGFRLYVPGWPLITLWALTIFGVGVGGILLSWAALRSALQPESSNEAERAIGASWLWLALASAIVGSLIAVLKLSPHPLFNHYDLAHVILMIGLYGVYRSVILRQSA